MSNSLIGQTLGHYRIADELGAGGMGVVYKAQDLQLGRMVALKVLPEGSASDEESTERFRREARTASSLNHPNICTIYGFDEHAGQLYLAMELLEGESLETRLTRGALELSALIDIGAQIAEGLDAAHSEGILHRDIKPANIFLTKRGQVKVLDFGLAKLANPANRQVSRSLQPTERFSSIVGTTVGTVSYMSPEQARGEDVDPRTDLFSFGVVLYEMATGQQSFSGATTAVVFDGILNRDPAPPSTLNASIPEDLDRIISKAIEKDRLLRYQSAADIRADLMRLRRDSGSRRMVAVGSRAGTDAVSASATQVLSHASASAINPARSDASVPPAAAPAVAPAAPERQGVSPMLVVGAAILLIGAAALAGVAWYVAQNPAQGSTTAPAPAPAPTQAEAAAPTPPPDAAPPVAALTEAAPPPTPPPAAAAPLTPTAPAGTAAGTSAGTARPTKPATAGTRPTSAAPTPRAAGPAADSPAPPPVDAAKAAEAERLALAEAAAADRLDAGRDKMQRNLFDQALVDFRQILRDHPHSSTAPDAAFLIAEVLEKQNKLEDAMAAHVDFGRQFSSNVRMAASRLRLGELTERSRVPNRENVARDLYAGVIRDYPRTPQAYQALQRKLRLDRERRPREADPVLGIPVPAAVPTLRTLTEQFPNAPASQQAYVQLAEAYENLQQYERAAQAFAALATNFPASAGEGWFRAGEIYERRLKDPARARDAFSRVPEASPRYRDAQRKLREK